MKLQDGRAEVDKLHRRIYARNRSRGEGVPRVVAAKKGIPKGEASLVHEVQEGLQNPSWRLRRGAAYKNSNKRNIFV